MERLELGQTTRGFNFASTPNKSLLVNRSFSLFYVSASTRDLVSLDIMVYDANDYNSLINVLKACINKRKQEREKMSPELLFIQDKLLHSGHNKDGTLTEDDIFSLISTMNINMTHSAVHKLFLEVDADQSNSIDANEATKLLHKLRER